ncbi:Heso1-like isoform x4 [Thalictrum thalictroides]|uniref:Heso1-like isoform x4 n=1 Tax=Thalictrum thalictroides TaxID=46969 RepID=A0A7J6VJ49_THATH|nr:Heso1-like isoform x4 [Thalictrum thalictroides]
MVMKEKRLRRKAKKLESKGLLKINFNPSCISTLDELLRDIYAVGRPTPNDYHVREDLVRVFDEMVKEVYGNSNESPVVEVFGSFKMDMFTVKSDLNLSVNFSNESVELPRDEKIKALRKLAKKLYRLKRHGHVLGVNPIVTAKVPILKVVDRGTGIECDISVENKDGILKSQFVFIVSEIDERFHILSSLMKAWAQAYGINSSKDHTLNSLSLILLVAFHLQTREPPILPPFSALLKDGTKPENVRVAVQDYLQYGKENKESIAELFVTLLSKLASVESLWPEGLCVSSYEGSWIPKTWNFKVGYISVEDFMDRSENVARAVGIKGTKAIYKCILSSLHHLSAFMEGRIQAPKLKVLLFGAEPIPSLGENIKNHKRTLPFHDTASFTAKRPRPAEGWNSWEEANWPKEGCNSWGEADWPTEDWNMWGRAEQPKEGWNPWREADQTYGAMNSLPPMIPPIHPEKHVFDTPELGIGFQQGSSWSWEPNGFPSSNCAGVQDPLGADWAWDSPKAKGDGKDWTPWIH